MLSTDQRKMVHEVEDSIMRKHSEKLVTGLSGITRTTVSLWITVMLVLCVSCAGEEKQHAPAVNEQDSLPFMQSKGISTLISDSGVMRYKITAEEWDIYNSTNPPTDSLVFAITYAISSGRLSPIL